MDSDYKTFISAVIALPLSAILAALVLHLKETFRSRRQNDRQ